MAADVFRHLSLENMVNDDSISDGVNSFRHFPGLLVLWSNLHNPFLFIFPLWSFLFNEVVPDFSCHQAKKDDSGVHAVDGLLLPAVKRCLIQECGDCRMDLVPWKRMIELCVFRKERHELFTEGDALSQLILLLENLLTHSL